MSHTVRRSDHAQQKCKTRDARPHNLFPQHAGEIAPREIEFEDRTATGKRYEYVSQRSQTLNTEIMVIMPEISWDPSLNFMGSKPDPRSRRHSR